MTFRYAILSAVAFVLATATLRAERDSDLAAFFDRAMEERLELFPLWAESLGDKSRNREWPEFTDAAADRELGLAARHLRELRAFDFESLNEADQLSYRLLENELENTINGDQWRDYGYAVNQMYGAHTMVSTHLANVHTIEDVATAEAYIERLDTIDELFAEVAATMRKRQELGILPPKFVYPKVIDASEKLLQGEPFEDGEPSVLLADFQEKIAKLGLEANVEQDLVARAKEALLQGTEPGYRNLIDTLEDQQAAATTEDGVWKFPSGSDYYSFMLKQTTTTDLTADQIHDIGLENVERIHDEMRQIMKKVGFGGDLQAFFKFTKNDDQFYYPDTEKGRGDYLNRVNTIVDGMRERVGDFFDLTPKAPMEARPVEEYREQSAGKAFYQRPSLDGSRPGYYYTNLRSLRDVPTYEMEALAYHEGIPGHHFQIALAQELEDVPLFQKVGGHTAFIEGWGLYAEELGKDMGFYEDPYSDFGRLAMELWRACRLVVDTGIHAKRWTKEEAMQYLIENTPNSLDSIESAIERYIVLPSQATAYMIGKLKIMELRDQAMKELGDGFDWRGFHNVVLASGSIPLDILEENVAEWIRASKG